MILPEARSQSDQISGGSSSVAEQSQTLNGFLCRISIFLLVIPAPTITSVDGNIVINGTGGSNTSVNSDDNIGILGRGLTKARGQFRKRLAGNARIAGAERYGICRSHRATIACDTAKLKAETPSRAIMPVSELFQPRQ